MIKKDRSFVRGYRSTAKERSLEKKKVLGRAEHRSTVLILIAATVLFS